MTKLTKADRKETMFHRLQKALDDMYHNATIPWVRLDENCPYPEQLQKAFEAFLETWVEQGFELLRSGGLMCTKEEEQRFLDIYSGARKKPARYYTTEIGAILYLRKHYGEFYQYGRGGRTAAPKNLVNCRGNILSAEDIAEKENREVMTKLILAIEYFNAFVKRYCRGIKEDWAMWVSDNYADWLDAQAEMCSYKANKLLEESQKLKDYAKQLS